MATKQKTNQKKKKKKKKKEEEEENHQCHILLQMGPLTKLVVLIKVEIIKRSNAKGT
jgi:hypothetical protein